MSNDIDNIAVILLAGVGRRMQHELPKSLLTLTMDNGETTTFVERNIQLLLQAGMSKVILVVSRQNQQHFSFLESESVILVLNQSAVESTGSSLSVAYGLEHVIKQWPNKPNVLIMDGDIIFDAGLLPFILNHADTSALYYISHIGDDIEEVRVYNRGNEPVLIGKGINDALAEGLTLVGESLGMILISATDVARTYQITQWLCGDPNGAKPFGYAKEKSEHEEIWQYLFNLQSLQVIEVPKQSLFSECDNREDYRNIHEHLWGKILQRDALLNEVPAV